MEYQKLGNSDLNVSKVALGLMRIADKTNEQAIEILQTAFDSGINFFDHADVYGRGKSELVFAKAMKSIDRPRESYYLQSKVGIMPGEEFNFTRAHILESVDKILERLETTYLDSLLLHRPDILWDPEEIADTFNMLRASGKVRNFGISNMNREQIELLQKYTDVPLIANQLQFSIMHSEMAAAGVYINTNLYPNTLLHQGLLDYLRKENITVQAWSPFQYGFFQGVFLDNPKFPELNAVLDRLAIKYNCTNVTLAVSWILAHPANIQVIIGTMTPARIAQSAHATNVKITRKEWYEIFMASGNELI